MDEKLIISEARLGTYLEFTDNNQDKAIELHNITLQLGSSLGAVIALVEIGLRNLVNDQLIVDFGDQNWMVNVIDDPTSNETLPLLGEEIDKLKGAKRQVQKASYAKLDTRQKRALEAQVFPDGVPNRMTDKNIAKRKQETRPVDHGQLIAQTTIFFWKRLFAKEYETLLWHPSLRKVFPQKHIKRPEVARNLEVIYAARNRVAHHEPIYGVRLDSLFESLQYIRGNLGRDRYDDVTAFERFTEIQFYRLYIDYTTFRRSWSLLAVRQ